MVSQDYQTDAFRENVILGNDVIFKCDIPSFISDFVSVEAWIDSEAEAYLFGQSGFDSDGKQETHDSASTCLASLSRCLIKTPTFQAVSFLWRCI